MEFGLFSLMPLRDTSKPIEAIYAETVAMARLAEDVGFDCVWLAEHHFGNYCMCPSPLVMAVHCAAHTKRIRLGTGVLVLPLYQPMRLVQEVGMVDKLTGGRLMVGIGAGYQDYEFARYGVPLDERWPRTHEMLDILEMGLEEGRVHYQGRFYQVPEAPVALSPRRRLPLYVTGNEPAILHRAARRGYVPFATTGSAPPESLARVRAHVEACFAEAGHEGEVPFAVQRMVYVTDRKADALRAAEERLYTDRLVAAFRAGRERVDGWEIAAQPYEDEASPEAIVAQNVVGDAETCVEKLLREIELLRPTHYSCFVQMGSMTGGHATRSLERFGAEVLPAVRKALGHEGKRGATLH